MRGPVKSKWLLFFSALVIIVVATVAVQSSDKENAMTNEGNETIALDVSIPHIDTLVPEVTETATFALG